MDCQKVGKLIFSLRKEKDMTQKQVADLLNVSDKTISKWERGLGCPDVSLLNELANVLGINIDNLLMGNLNINDADGGNMKRTKFYVCSTCGKVVTSTDEIDVSCCGRKLVSLTAKEQNEEHTIKIEEVETEIYLTFSHEMTKEHYISFIAVVTCDKVLIVKLYPEQSPEIRLPRLGKSKIYFYCNKHGLWVM